MRLPTLEWISHPAFDAGAIIDGHSAEMGVGKGSELAVLVNSQWFLPFAPLLPPLPLRPHYKFRKKRFTFFFWLWEPMAQKVILGARGQ